MPRRKQDIPRSCSWMAPVMQPRHAAKTRCQDTPIAQLICPTGAFPKTLSSPLCKNISVFQKVESGVSCLHPASLAEGRIAIVTTREAGMRWTWRGCLTSGDFADGEVVWSWRPKVRRQVRDDALRITRATVANGMVHRGELV